jgi:threonine aldolase
MKIDLRSDTVTKPTKGMMDAIMQARTGDDVFKEDPTVNELEQRFCDLFGMDEALFFPTGTMANQAAIKLHTQPGDQIICDVWSHIYNYEAGGAAFNSGVSCKLINGHRGMITAEQVEQSINHPDFYHSPLTKLVGLENTTNKGGGACYDLVEINRIKKVCDDHGLSIHLDGARLMNALVAKGEDPKEYGRIFDTISVCLSKGLGTPLGTILMGNKDIMKKSIRIRKIFGGGMRQIGFMAAAGLYALDHHVDRMKDDHQRAAEIASTLNGLKFILNVEPTETNIVIFYLDEGVSETQFMKDLSKNDIRIYSMGEGKLRMVTHLDYTSEMHDRVREFLSSYKP